MSFHVDRGGPRPLELLLAPTHRKHSRAQTKRKRRRNVTENRMMQSNVWSSARAKWAKRISYWAIFSIASPPNMCQPHRIFTIVSRATHFGAMESAATEDAENRFDCHPAIRSSSALFSPLSRHRFSFPLPNNSISVFFLHVQSK